MPFICQKSLNLNDLRTFVARFCREDLRTFSAEFVGHLLQAGMFCCPTFNISIRTVSYIVELCSQMPGCSCEVYYVHLLTSMSTRPGWKETET